jgi:hypothetical protein
MGARGPQGGDHVREQALSAAAHIDRRGAQPQCVNADHRVSTPASSPSQLAQPDACDAGQRTINFASARVSST